MKTYQPQDLLKYIMPMTQDMIKTTIVVNDMNFISHRGIGKTTFICRQLIHDVVNERKNTVVYFNSHDDITTFLKTHLLPALTNQKTIRYSKISSTDIVVTSLPLYDDPKLNYKIYIVCRINKTIQQGSILVEPQIYMDNFNVLFHDSCFVDPMMVDELCILKLPDDKLPCYIDHQWRYELLKNDFLQRLKNAVI